MSIELTVVLEGNYQQWQRECREQVAFFANTDDPSIDASTDELLEIADFVGATPKPSWSFTFSPDTRVKDAEREIVRQMRPLFAERKLPLGARIVRFVTLEFLFEYEFEYPTAPHARYNRRKTLSQVGLCSGDLVVIGYYKPPMGTISYLAEPAFNAIANRSLRGDNLVDFLDSVISDERNSWRVDMWDGNNPRPSSILGGVVLYTEEDWELASYVRQHYAPLHVLSGHYLTLYFFEYMPPSKSDDSLAARGFWSDRLPQRLNSLWSAFGMTRCKPHLNEYIYHIADSIDVSSDSIPCIVFFRKWKSIKTDRIVLPIVSPYPQFFRRTCSDFTRALHTYQGKTDEHQMLSSFSLESFSKHLPHWWMKSAKQPLSTKSMVKVFFSYSHKDESLRDKLARHLSVLRRSGSITTWHDRKIGAGTEWKSAIDNNLESSDLILLLISENFLASDYCYDKEMARAMELHAQGKTRVIPIVLSPCDWHAAPFGMLQALPQDAKPITTWTNREKAFTDIAKSIRQIVEELRGT